MVEHSPGILFLDVLNPRAGLSPLHDPPATSGRPKMDLSTAPVFAMEPTGNKALLERYQAAFSSLLSFHIKMEDIILSNKKRRRQSEEVGKMLTNLTETLSTPVHLKVRMSLDPSRDKQFNQDVTITLTPPRPPNGSGQGSRRAASSSKSPYKSSPYRLAPSQSKAGIVRSPSVKKHSPCPPAKASGTVAGTGAPKATDAFKLYFSLQSTPSHSTRSPLPLYVSSPSDIAALQQLVTGVGSMLGNAAGPGIGTGTGTVGSDKESSTSSWSASRPRKTQTPLKLKQPGPQAKTPGAGTGTGTPRRKPISSSSSSSSWSVGRVATITTPAPAALSQEGLGLDHGHRLTSPCLNTPAPAAAPPASVFGSRGGRLQRTPPPPKSAVKLSPRGRPSLGSALSKGVLSPQPQPQPQPKLSLSPKPQLQPHPHNPSPKRTPGSTSTPTAPSGGSRKSYQSQSASSSNGSSSSLSLSPRTLPRSVSASPCPGPGPGPRSSSSSSSSSSAVKTASASATAPATASAMSPRSPFPAAASASASAYSPRGCDSASRRKLLLASTESLLAELGACLG